MSRVLFLVWFLVMGLVNTNIAHAEERKTDAVPQAKGWKNQAEGSFLLAAGNSESTTLGAGLESSYVGDVWATKGAAKYLTNTSGGARQAEIFSLDARGDRSMTNTLALFVQGSFFRNIFAGFRSRYSLDVGLGWSVVKSEQQDLSLEASVGGIGESRVDGHLSFGAVKGAVNYTCALTPTSDLENKLTLLQNVNDGRDWRLSNVLSVSFVVTTLISTKVSLRVDHLNSPVLGKKPTDLTTQVSLVAKF